MGEISKEASRYTNEITEIIPKMFEHVAVKKHNIMITEDFGERLKKLQEHSDAFIVLPGGFGSLQEIMDVLVAKQLGFHSKPIVIINTRELYSPIIQQIKNSIKEGFAPKDNHALIHVAKTPEEALEYINNYSPIKIKDKHGA